MCAKVFGVGGWARNAQIVELAHRPLAVGLAAMLGLLTAMLMAATAASRTTTSGVVTGALALAGLAVVWLLSRRVGRVALRADEHGIELRGTLRTARVAWVDVPDVALPAPTEADRARLQDAIVELRERVDVAATTGRPARLP